MRLRREPLLFYVRSEILVERWSKASMSIALWCWIDVIYPSGSLKSRKNVSEASGLLNSTNWSFYAIVILNVARSRMPNKCWETWSTRRRINRSVDFLSSASWFECVLLGYPIFVSPLITSYSSTSEPLNKIVGGELAWDLIREKLSAFFQR